MTVLQCIALLAVIASVGLWAACTWEPSLAGRATVVAKGEEASDLRLAGGSGVSGTRSDRGGRLQRREHRSK
jgi:hypothetical protein